MLILVSTFLYALCIKLYSLSHSRNDIQSVIRCQQCENKQNCKLTFSSALQSINLKKNKIICLSLAKINTWIITKIFCPIKSFHYKINWTVNPFRFLVEMQFLLRIYAFSQFWGRHVKLKSNESYIYTYVYNNNSLQSQWRWGIAFHFRCFS